MKNILIVLAFLSAVSTFGQGNRNNAKQVKSLKVAFITNELDLTPEEAAKFWPVYNEFEKRRNELRRRKIQDYVERKNTSIDQLSEKEAQSILSQMAKDDDQLHSLKKNLNSDLSRVISAHKILKLKKAEEDFSRRLLKQYRQKKK